MSNRSRKVKLASLQSFFIPWIGVFNQVYEVDTFAIADNLQYEKNSWINRNRIKNINGGFIWLIVPLKKASVSAKINERLIDNDQNWRKKHLRAIEFNYQKAPYFDDFYPAIREIYLKNHDYLIDLNSDLFNFFLAELDLKTKIIQESNFDLPKDKNAAIIKLCKENGSNTYFSGPAANVYLDRELFKQEGIEIILQNCQDMQYPQLGGDWVPKLSIIDTLFMLGAKQTRKLIEQLNKVCENYE